MKASFYKNKSKKTLESLGYLVDDAEKKILRPGRPFPMTKDLFGFIDLLAIDKDGTIAAIQVTSKQQMAKHRTKFELNEAFLLWIKGKNKFILHGWWKSGTTWMLEVQTAEIKVIDKIEFVKWS